MSTMNMNAIIELYRGGLIASAMAEALFEETGLKSPVSSSAHRSKLAAGFISNLPRRRLARREEGAILAEKLGQELAKNIDVWSNWSNGSEVIQSQIDLIQYFTLQRDTGLDPTDSRDVSSLAATLLEVRRLKNDGRRMIKQALDSAKACDMPLEYLAAVALTSPVAEDYAEWAKAAMHV